MRYLFLTLAITLGGFVATGTPNSYFIEWERFLQRHDPVFCRFTQNWYEGAFTGNGLLGTMLYQEGKDTLRIDVGRTDVFDHQGDEVDKLFGKARLIIGHFRLLPPKNIQSVVTRMDLWNAEVRSSISLGREEIPLSMFTAAEEEVIVIEIRRMPCKVEWCPGRPVSTRTQFFPTPENYRINPEPELFRNGTIQYCFQPLGAGGGYTTAWKKTETDSNTIYFITIQNSPAGRESVRQAEAILSNLEADDVPHIRMKHREWWHSFYPESFMTMPDAQMESFYWIQQYKLASATREDKPAIDLQGPWPSKTPWPGYWMNLNIQLTYSPLYTANRLSLASSLIKMIDAHTQQLIDNAPVQYRYNSAAVGRTSSIDMVSPVYVTTDSSLKLIDLNAEVGNLTWVLYYYWQHYRYSMDRNLLEKFYPLLKRSINYYLHLIRKNDGGQWEFAVKTYSPEYPGGTDYNTNYDLSLLRWGLQVLLRINEEQKYNDPLAVHWKDVLQNLVPYPQDSTGLRISSSIPYAQSHRHFSHMLMIYPLYLLHWDQPENRDLIERSLKYWHSKPQALQGYSFTGSASVYAMMGEGDKAKKALKELLNKFVRVNTMYKESGPVIETPLAAAASMQELYLQYWNNIVRIFPAVPSDWPDAAFEHFRTEGAFLISAVRKGGKTRWVKIESLAGGEVKIKPGFTGNIKIKSVQKRSFKHLGDGIYSCYLPKGSEIVLYTDKKDLNIPIQPVAYIFGNPNGYGLK